MIPRATARRIIETECWECAARVELTWGADIPDGWSWRPIVQWEGGKREEVEQLTCPDCTAHYNGEGPF